MAQYVIGVDLGGTFIKLAAFDSRGRVLGRRRVLTGSHENGEKILANLASVTADLCRELPDRKPLAVGVGVPGILDLDRGLLVKSPNLSRLEGSPLRDWLAEVLSCPVILENDANAAAVGEKWLGAGRRLESFLFVTLGTGVGGGLILDGKLWKGVRGGAGEFGHLVVEPDGPPCGCGGRGCLETYASATGIARMAREAIGARRPSLIRELAGEQPDAIDPELVSYAAKHGDPVALEIYRQVGRYLGIAITDVVNLLDLHHFILGGGVSHALPLFAGSLRDELRSRTFGIAVEKIHIMQAECGEDAGLLGAGYLALGMVTTRGRTLERT